MSEQKIQHKSINWRAGTGESVPLYFRLKSPEASEFKAMNAKLGMTDAEVLRGLVRGWLRRGGNKAMLGPTDVTPR